MSAPIGRFGFFGGGLRPTTPTRMGHLPRAWRAMRSSSSFIASEPSLSLLVAVAATVEGVAAFAALLTILVRRSASDAGATHPVSSHQWILVGVSVGVTLASSAWLSGALSIRLLTFLRGEPVSVTRASLQALMRLPRLLSYSLAHVLVALTTQPLRRNGGSGGIARLFFGRKFAQRLRLRSALSLPIAMGEGLKGKQRRMRSLGLLTESPSAGAVITNPLSPVMILTIAILAGASSYALSTSKVLALTIGLIGLVIVMTLLTVVSTSFWTALYVYLTNDAAPLGFQVDDLLAATTPPKRRRDRKRPR